MDFLYLLAILAFFALSWGFVRMCAALEPVPQSTREERK